jgi:uncharacterized protein YndB with AHSA1/START domain
MNLAAHAIQTTPTTVRIERLLPGPLERVWAFLTEPDKRGLWLARGGMALQVGGEVELVFNNSALTGNDGEPPPKYARHACESSLHCLITACEPPRLLAYTWGENSEVRFELEPRGDEVHLRVTHSRLSDRDARLSVASGWHTHLDMLVERLNGRTPPGFWPTHTRLEAEYQQRIA